MNYRQFCNNILNIRNIDASSQIKKIVIEEKEKILNMNSNLSGYCKYIASIIEERLKEINVRTYWLDLNELINIDHVVLIVEYKYNNQIKRILIDPTYIQFVKKENAKLLKLQSWPSEKIDKEILQELLTSGCIDLNTKVLNNYLSAFGKHIELNLDDFLINYQQENLTRKK